MISRDEMIEIKALLEKELANESIAPDRKSAIECELKSINSILG